MLFLIGGLFWLVGAYAGVVIRAEGKVSFLSANSKVYGFTHVVFLKTVEIEFIVAQSFKVDGVVCAWVLFGQFVCEFRE